MLHVIYVKKNSLNVVRNIHKIIRNDLYHAVISHLFNYEGVIGGAVGKK